MQARGMAANPIFLAATGALNIKEDDPPVFIIITLLFKEIKNCHIKDKTLSGSD